MNDCKTCAFDGAPKEFERCQRKPCGWMSESVGVNLKGDPGVEKSAEQFEGLFGSPIDSARATQVGGAPYRKMSVQSWDVIDTWPLEQRVGYYRGCALKHIMRLRSNDAGEQEARRAEHYCKKLAETLETI